MTHENELLRTGLNVVAERAESVDLYQRSLNRSRQIGRRRAIGGASALAAVIALASVGTWQLLPRSDNGPMRPAEPTVTAPSSTDPTVAPSVAASGGPQLSLDLANETFDLPAWSRRDGSECPTKRVVLKKGSNIDEHQNIVVELTKSVSVDIDGDGARETIALLSCAGPGQSGVEQVVAFRGAPGAVTLVGQVVGEIPDLGAELSFIEDIAVAGRSVRAKVGNGPQGSVAPTHIRVRQWRTYEWSGSRFAQTAGSTTFLADSSVADLSVTTSRLIFGKADRGCRVGTITMKVHNKGPQSAVDVSAALIHGQHADKCPQSGQQQGSASSMADIGTVAPGATKTVTVSVVTIDGADTISGTTDDSAYHYVELRAGDRRYPTRTTFGITFN